MHSHLRYQATFAPFSAHSTESSYPHATSPPPQKKQRMTITQTYRLAHSARGKLSSEASRGDHDLRLLVGHANLLDNLMLELQDAENEQEAWFNETMKSSSPKSPEEPKHIQWKDEVIRQQQSEAFIDEADSDSDDEYDDALETITTLRKVRSPPAPVSPIEYYGDDEEYDDEDSDDEFDNLDLALVRTRSRQVDDHQSQFSDPPELVHDNSDDSDDESSPPNTPPQQLSIDLSDVHHQQGIKAQDFGFDDRKAGDALIEDGFFIPSRTEQAPLIAAY